MRANRWFEIKHWTDITVADLPYVESPFFASSFIERSLRDDFKASDIISSLSGYYFRSTKSDIPRKGARGYKQWQEAFTKKAGLGEVLLVYKDKQKPFCSVVKETEEGLTPEGDSFALANRLIARANPAPPPPPAVTGKVSEVTQLIGNVGWSSTPKAADSYKLPSTGARPTEAEKPTTQKDNSSPAAKSQAKTLQTASEKGTPFCETCNAAKASSDENLDAVSAPVPTPELFKSKEKVPEKLTDLLDYLRELSPTLDYNLEMLSASRWKVDAVSTYGKGSCCDRDEKVIYYDSKHLDNQKYFAQTMAHESGHAMYIPPAPPSPNQVSKEEFVRHKLTNMLIDEGEATMVNMQIRAEILEAGGPDIGVAGANEKEYLGIFDEYQTGKISRQDARVKIAKVFAHKERPSSNPNVTYAQHYGAACSRQYDRVKGIA
ncbi:hypothetical protein [Hahella sp. HN01]|uniref:hypothetical protein n=1 Tax=Hahella sp. HN01 TaxID=2847262 RepID=UPI001C1F0D08|nr:hypothetical protein [Hahella sp. HN01]MBU6952283.1 hypothetical protein [Hahella sp. HN01]